MNEFNGIGRLTKAPEVRYSQDGNAVARFSIAINRGKGKNGNDLGADYPRIVVFGKQAENCQRYLDKGMLVGITGRVQTGSYEKNDGTKVYTTDIVANRVEFLEFKGKAENTDNNEFGFEPVDEAEIPF